MSTNYVERDANHDITTRLFKSTYPSQAFIPDNSSIAFRVDSDEDNYIRFASVEALKDFLGEVRDSSLLQGQTAEAIKIDIRNGFVPNTVKINGHRLDKNITLKAMDVGLNNVANYGNSSSPLGASTSLYATQRAAYEAAAAPRLELERKRIIDVSDSAPASDAPDGLYIIIDKNARTFQMKVKDDGIIYTQA